MSDILKHIGIGARPVSDPPAQGKENSEPLKKIPSGSKPEIENDNNLGGGVQISKAMKHREGISQEEHKEHISKVIQQTHFRPEDSRYFYDQGLELVKNLFAQVQLNESLDARKLYCLTENIVGRLVLGDNELLGLSFGYTPDNYLAAHCLNVAIISIELGLGKGYNKSKLTELGLSALLYDIGMTKVMDLANQPRTLNNDEYAKIQKHTLYGVEIIRKINGIDQHVIDVASEHHERFNGNGYPQKLSASQISDYGQIISLCDVYEAMVHPRVYRPRKDNQEAIKDILRLNNEKYFNLIYVKILLGKIGIFPVGSWVELNTGEIGKVISVNEEYPLRPNIKVVFSMSKQKYPDSRLLELAKQQSIYIKRQVDLKDVGINI